MTGDQPRASRSLAEKLNHLFIEVRPRSGSEYTLEEAVNGIRAHGGPDGTTISVSYLWQLRKGLRTNPTVRHLEAIAGFFGVPAAYFLDDDTAARVDEQLDSIALLRDRSVHRLASRAAGLSPSSLRAITDMIESARRLEGLPDSDQPDAGTGDRPQGGSPSGELPSAGDA